MWWHMRYTIHRAGRYIGIVCSVFLISVLCGMSVIQGITGTLKYKTWKKQPDVVSVTSWQTEGVNKNDPLPLEAASAVLVDAENGRVLYEKQGYEQRAMASTTKIMTLIIALEYGNLEDPVTISSYAASMPQVRLNVHKGEQYYLKDLLYSLMLESHNDVAVAIAEHIGGNVEGFAALMNQKAAEIGAYHTNFVTPNGLDDDAHYSTAYDMALIARYAISNPQFIEITNTTDYTFADISNNRSFSVHNHNAFLHMYDGAIGVKTGFTGNAGYCFVGAVTRDEHTMIAVVLGCGWPPHKNYKWKDMRALFDYGFSCYKQRTVYKPEQDAVMLSVHDGIEADWCYGYTEETVRLYMADWEQVTYRYHVPEYIEAPVKQGEVIGSVEILINDQPLRRVAVRAATGIRHITFEYCLGQILRLFCGQEISI